MKKKTNELAPYLFHQGTNCAAQEYLGAHREGKKIVFRVWAPNAHAAFLVGDFNSWDESLPMQKVTSGIYEVSVSADKIKQGDLYKFKFHTDKGDIYKSDPYGRFYDAPPEMASRFYESKYEWKDGGWLEYRRGWADKKYEKPLNIYELHLGSWHRHEDGSYYTYREIAKSLAPYVKKMGYTHIELMPVMEHPFDGSWGYQVTGYFAPTARYGTPDDFRAFVDHMHRSGIGVILDWVPAHFPKDAPGLYEFDGKPLYEYQGQDRIEHEGWGTRRFDVGREEIQSFLVSNACYWINEFHADGLRVDAVASMLYLDYDKRPGEWVPNVYGDNRCLEAIAFFKKLNSHIKDAYPDVMMIAEESTAWSNITGFENDGLGFDYKWNMGWMNDTLNYAETDPYFRSGNHGRLTFPLCYSFSEKFVLPISHDEVVHGKKSFLDRMPGEYKHKFAGARLFSAYQMLFPGKKLTFMGQEIGQFREWDYEGEIEWFLLDYEMHAKFKRYFAKLNHFYLSHPALYERDLSWDGFSWIYPDMKDISVSAFYRTDKGGKSLFAVLNFTPVARYSFELELPYGGQFKEVFNTDLSDFGGEGMTNSGKLRAFEVDGKNKIRINLPPLSCLVFEKV